MAKRTRASARPASKRASARPASTRASARPAPKRASARPVAKRASARPAAKRALITRRLTFTPALLANVRRRYEASDEPLATMAADLGCSHETLRNVAKRERWQRFVPPPRDLTPAARLAARAEKLARNRHPEVAAQRPSKDDSQGLEGSGRASFEARATSGALAPQDDGESQSGAPASEEPPLVADTAEALHRELLTLLAELRATRARMKRERYPKHDLRQTSQVIASLTATLRALAPLLCPVAPAGAEQAYDDMPADIDEFRNEFARRIRAFFAARQGGGDAGGDAARLVGEGGA